MANQATTLYRISSDNKQSVIEFWNILQSMNVNTKNIWLDELAKRYGIDYEARHISVRGHIYWAEYNEEDNILSIETETAWDKSELIEEINKVQGYPFSVSYRVCECGCEVFYVHDEGSFFTEECCVSSYGEPFDEACEDVFATIEDAINEWTSKTCIEQGERTNEEMMNFINEYEYENGETYFYIYPFTFE